MKTTNELLHPAQLQAFEKLKRMRVGALYIDRQDGKLRTVAELVKYRLAHHRIDGVLWLCTRRRVDLIQSGILRYAAGEAKYIEVCGIETLSHNLQRFLDMMDRAKNSRLMLVIDNGLLIKNPNALRTQRVIAISGKCLYRLLIGDMPFSGYIGDIYSQWYALDWRILGYSTFYGFSINHIGHGRKPLNTEYIVQAIEPYCAQIQREDVQNTARRRELIWRFQLPERAMDEYRATMDRFIWKAMHSTTGVYRMLQACQHVVSGRRIVNDYPLTTEPMYAVLAENPRICALLDVIGYFPGKRILILCRYVHEKDAVLQILSEKFGKAQINAYAAQKGEFRGRFTVMNIFSDEREDKRLASDVIIYYSNDWNWRKRQEKERQCQNALQGGELTVVSLVAADTVDYRMLRCVWAKDNLIRKMREELARSLHRMENTNAEDL